MKLAQLIVKATEMGINIDGLELKRTKKGRFSKTRQNEKILERAISGDTSPPTRSQGMNWIRKPKRLAIYLRDGMRCPYCGAGVEDEGVTLSLDHILPYSHGGSNSEENLITCCTKCNSARQDREIGEFVEKAADFYGFPPEKAMKYIAEQTAKKLKPFLVEAKELIARRGSYTAAMNSKKMM